VSSSEVIDVAVSRRVLWVGAQAYPLQNIARAQTVKLVPDRGAALRRYLHAFVLWVFLTVAAAVALRLAPRISTVQGYKAAHYAAAGVLVLVAVLAVVSTIRLIATLSRRTYYALILETAGTPRRVLVSDDENLVRQLVRRIMAAIDDPQADFVQPVVNYNLHAHGSQSVQIGGHHNISQGAAYNSPPRS
jgi:Family of unknown function (DUF6232)